VPKQINTYTFGQALVKRFGLKGRFQPVLDETIVPVTLVDEAIERRPAFAGFEAPAVAGEYSSFQLLNPNDSGIVVRVEQIWVSAAAFGLLRLSIDSTWTLGTKTQKTSVWRKTGTPGRPAAEFYYGQSTFKNVDLGFIGMTTVPTLILQPGIILPNGGSLMLQNDNVASAFFVTILWTEEYANLTDAP
jgi:hypothetical protein